MSAWTCLWCRKVTEGDPSDPAVCEHCSTPRGASTPAESLSEPFRRHVRPAEMKRWARQADRPATNQTILSLCLADITAQAAQRERPKPKVRAVPDAEKHLLEIAPVDLHVGKYAWDEEAGSNYDIRIAERVFTEGVDDILERAPKMGTIEGIVLIVGNDLLQTDNAAGTTTAGTYVDTDSRYIKAFRRAHAVNSWAIQECAKVAPVHVVIVPGNHDTVTAFTIGMVLEAEFKLDPRVTVHNGAKRRKFLKYGVTLLGWTHGNEEKAADLPLIMAQEEPQLWAETTHREWHVGHLHKMKETRFTAGDSFNGVRVRVLPSLCAPDAWHYTRGYVGEQRACEAYLFNRVTGYAGHLSTNVRHEVAA